MAYQVDRFNGTFFVSVGDGTIDTTSDLRLVGKNYAGYGELQNENFLHLLENFSNTTPPPKAISGQIWYDSGNKKLKFFDGTRFKSASGAEIGPTAPSGLQTGDFWFDTSAEQLYAWSGTEFVLIGPETSPDLGASAFTTVVVKDENDGDHIIAKLTISNTVIGVLSKDDFRLKVPDSNIPGFDRVRKGFTLINTIEANNGITSDDHYYWGTASAARGLVGPTNNLLTFNDLVLQSQLGSFDDNGFYVGDQNDLRVWIESGVDPIIESTQEAPVIIRINNTSNIRRDVAIFTKDAVLPGIGNFYDLGSSVNNWKTTYSSSFIGNLTGSVTGNTTGIHTGNLRATDNSVAYDAENKTFFGTFGSPTNISLVYGNVVGNVTGNATNASALNNLVGEEGPVPSSVAVRDSGGNITATRFIGVANTADRIKVDNTAVDTDPNYRTAKTISSADTIAARDGAGDLEANLFRGTATAARYADLAEKYLADEEYSVGTVVVIGGEKEITASSKGQRAIGAISLNPAFMMNKDLEGGVYVALKGRVPVKVKGPVNKGDRLVADDNGIAVVVRSSADVFAIALEASESTDVELIEAVVL
jgi:hypothetical protein